MPEPLPNFRRFEISVFLHFIGRGLYSVFVPIIMLQNGYSLARVLLFLLFSASVTIITSAAAPVACRQRRVIFLNLIATSAEIALLLFLTQPFSPPLLIAIAIAEGLYYTFYYLSYFSLLTHGSQKETMGQRVGNLEIAVTLAGLFVPLIGALVLRQSSIALVFVSTIFLSLSLLPLRQLKNTDVNGINQPTIRWQNVAKQLSEFMILSAIEIVLFTLWPVAVYLAGFPLVVVSSIPIAEALMRIVITQKIKNKIREPRFCELTKRLALFGIMAASVYRFLSPAHVLLSNLVFGFLFLLLHLTITTTLFQKLKGYRTYHTSAMVSIAAFIARALVIILTLVVGLKYTMLLPIPAALLYFLLMPAWPKWTEGRHLTRS